MSEKGYPERLEAEALLCAAEALNPGPWSDHSRVVAKCAEAIARACGDMDAEKAYVLGLTHDIGRRFGVGHLTHVYDGYVYMRELGYFQAARICLTHSFCTHRLADYVGNVDVTPEQRSELEDALAACDFDDYDRLIQLCDAIGMAHGAVAIEERMGDVKRRYGTYPQAKWEQNIALKAYFEQKAGRSVEELTAGLQPGNGNEFTVNEMLAMQTALQDRYKGKWEPVCPETGKNKLLWMVGEIGEVIDIVKKTGATQPMTDARVRSRLVEELADVLMYYNDVLLCYGITSEELKRIYKDKFHQNMKRW